MNGSQSNGSANGQTTAATGEADSQIIHALEIVHNPRSSNEHRQEAYQFLENIKVHPEAPFHGFALANNPSYPYIVRHFGLSLLETAVRYRWDEYSPEQTATVRGWVLELTQSITAADPAFIRNKIAQLWCEVAKRSWMLDWKDMDELLVKIWQAGPIEKFFVMEVLENLAENSFGKEDAVAAIRGDDLTNYCLDIFTPLNVFREHFPKRDDLGCRHGEEGWLLRVADFLSWCLAQDPKDDTVATCAVKAATTLKSCLEWVHLRALYMTNIPDRLCQALMSTNRTLALEALQCLFLLFCRRPKFQANDVTDLLLPMFSAERIEILRKIYLWSMVEADDIDEERYLICKKLTPLLFQLGLFLESWPTEILQQADMGPYFTLLVQTLQSQSLHVSIPIMHLFALLMGIPPVRQSPVVMERLANLLQICSERLVKYEDLPPDSELPSVVFLQEDVETAPERHQFLGNYARFAKDVIDGIVQQQPKEALQHILNQTSHLLSHLYDNEPEFDREKCSKYSSVPTLRLDAQASVIEAAVFGYAKWRSEQRAVNPDQEAFARQQAEIDALLEQWVMRWLSQTYDDPATQQRLVIIFISIAVGPLRKSQALVTNIFQYIMQTKMHFVQKEESPVEVVAYDLQHDELQRFCSHQLQRLAIKSHDFLATEYDGIEARLQEFVTNLPFSDDDRERVLSVPFIILQRATGLPEEQRRAKLAAYVESRLAPWSEPKLNQALQSLGGFCELTAIAGFEEQFHSRSATVNPDWSSTPIRQPTTDFKLKIDDCKRDIPIRITRTILGASVDRADAMSLEVAKLLWAQHVPVILPQIVTLIKLSIQFSAPSTWTDAPAETQALVRRIMKDRFWQVGISSGTRDDFYNRVTSTRNTLEGLASAIRGCIRDVRETSFKILALFTYLGDVTYQFDGLASALSEAMFSHPMALSTHQTVVLLETARALIEQCPKERFQSFLPTIMTALFNYLDEKISREWSVLDQKKEAASEDDDLTEEMKEESILRNLTFTAVMFVTRIFDPSPGSRAVRKAEPGQESPIVPERLDIFVMENPQIFKSIILFCTHVLRMHDSRCCNYILKVLRNIIPIFTVEQNANISDNDSKPQGIPHLSPEIHHEIREFISTEVFKACITSLHDPYFVDIQPDLAGLIARVLYNYGPLTSTPASILLSLPEMDIDRIESAIRQIIELRDSKRQKNVVLKLLAGLRGISISEQGKILQQQVQQKSEARKKQDTTTNKYAQGAVDAKDIKVENDDDGALDGVADMFRGQ